MSEEKKEYLFKILVIGEVGTGKTSIIKRYVHNFFSETYRATIGVDFALKILNWDSNTVVRVQLWDIAGRLVTSVYFDTTNLMCLQIIGQERFGSMTRVYYREAVGAMVVFDATRLSTYEAAARWKHDLDNKLQLPNGQPVPTVLLANKCDQLRDTGSGPGLVASHSQLDEFCQQHGFIGWFETSAKENIKIDESARFLIEKVIENDKAINAHSEDVADNSLIRLQNNTMSPADTKQKNSGGMCSKC